MRLLVNGLELGLQIGPGCPFAGHQAVRRFGVFAAGLDPGLVLVGQTLLDLGLLQLQRQVGL
ncbi:hypothetical protein D3C87_2125060 [compost metagenome]